MARPSGNSAHASARPHPTAIGGLWHELTAWIGLAIAWFALPLKRALASVLRPATKTLLDIPATPRQFPPIESIQNDLVALHGAANDGRAAPSGAVPANDEPASGAA